MKMLVTFVRSIRRKTLKKMIMKTFKIEFLDKDGNELWTSLTEQYNLEDCQLYAKLLFANSNVNDLCNYLITEL